MINIMYIKATKIEPLLKQMLDDYNSTNSTILKHIILNNMVAKFGILKLVELGILKEHEDDDANTYYSI